MILAEMPEIMSFTILNTVAILTTVEEKEYA